MTGQRFKQISLDGLLRNNPTFRLVLGTCPTLALSTAAFNGIGMGLAVTFILICSNVLISLLRKAIPNAVRIPAFVIIIATFVTIVRMVLDKFIPSLYESMGVYLPLIVVNCIILGRAESFASKNKVLDSALDGREVLGSGAIFGYQLWDFRIGFFSSSAGAFFVYGMSIALFNHIYSKIENKMRSKNFEARIMQKPDIGEPENELADQAEETQNAALQTAPDQNAPTAAANAGHDNGGEA